MQFKQTRGYLSQACGFPALKDRAVIIVNASNLHFAAHNEVWKGDREHLRRTLLGERYTKAVTATIKESQALKDLQAKIAQQELESAAKSERNELFQKLVDQDPTLGALLSDRDPTVYVPSSGGMDRGGESGESEFAGKYAPSFVRLEERFRHKDLVIPVNRSRPLGARTDAENGYLQRADNIGQVVLDEAIREKFEVREQLRNGRLTVFLQPIEEQVQAGETLTFRLGLVDDSMAQPVMSELVRLKVVDDEPAGKSKGKQTNAKAGAGGKNDGKGDRKPTRGLPHYKLLSKDGREINGQPTEKWPADFSEIDGGDVKPLGEGEFLYLINYDNAYHLKYRMKGRGQVAKDVVTEKYVLGMRIVMLGFEHALRDKLRKGAEESTVLAEASDEMRRVLARTAASTVLALAENLPKIVDATSAQQQDDVE